MGREDLNKFKQNRYIHRDLFVSRFDVFVSKAAVIQKEFLVFFERSETATAARSAVGDVEEKRI